MKIKLTSIIILIFSFLISCDKDDDNSSDDGISLVGTVWEGEGAEDGIYTFSSATEFTFVDQGEEPVDGTYTFDGSDGVLTEETGFVAPFSISGGIMSVEGINSTRIYIRQ